MPEHLKNKIYPFEVEPPAAAWETIAARLNEDEQSAALRTKMFNYVEVPPPATWQAIAARLSEDEQYHVFTAKMNQYSEDPPFNAWNNILTSLKETKTSKIESPVINIGRKIYRVAVAAVITGLLIGGWLILNKEGKKNDLLAKKNVPVLQTNSGQNNKSRGGSLNRQNDTETTIKSGLPVYISGKIFPLSSQKSNDEVPLLKYSIVNTPPSYNEHTTIIISYPVILNESGAVIRDLNVLTSNNDYLLVAGPNGQLTRISSKFANVIRYLNGGDYNVEGYLDKVIKESSTWKNRFQEWRNKISQSAFIPSSANFLDIIELKELIEEKQ